MNRAVQILLLGAVTTVLSLSCAKRLDPPEPDESARVATRDQWLELAVESIVADGERLLRIADRVREGGAPVCGNQIAPLLGIQVSQRVFVGGAPPPLAEALLRRFEVERRPTVTLVDPDAPAAQAGVRSGDQLLRANGRRLRNDRQLFEALREQPGRAPKLEIERDGERRTLTLPMTPACAFEVQLAQTDSLSTWRAPENHAVIGRGLLRLGISDDELALLIAHELGHRILGDRGFPDHARELHADELAFEILARSGFDPAVAPSLYARLATEKPWLIDPDPRSHETGAPERKGEESRHGGLAARIVAARDWLGRGLRLPTAP